MKTIFPPVPQNWHLLNRGDGVERISDFCWRTGIFFNFSGEVFKKYRHFLRKGEGERGSGPILTFTDGGEGRGGRKEGIEKVTWLKAALQEIGDDWRLSTFPFKIAMCPFRLLLRESNKVTKEVTQEWYPASFQLSASRALHRHWNFWD